LFNRAGDCLAAKLRPGNVHSAEGWEELLLPEIERQQQRGKVVVVFRADAAFAKPELYEALEQRQVKYVVRLPANDNLERKVAQLLKRPVGRPSYQPVVRYKSFLSGSELDQGTARGSEGGVPLRGVVPAGRVYGDQLPDFEPGGGTLLQQARNGRAVDQGRQAGGRDDAA
jgi:hypothetical protein